MRNLKMTLLASAFALVAAAAQAAVYTVPADISAGRLNIRSGPGTIHALLGYIPAGETVDVGRCVRRDDGIVGSDFCRVNYNGMTGWAASSGLMPGYLPTPEPAPRAQAPSHEFRPGMRPATPTPTPTEPEMVSTQLRCTPPLARGDRNPVIRIWVSFEYDATHRVVIDMNVRHEFYNGDSVDRFQQYRDARVRSNGTIFGWTGTYSREPDKTMAGGAFIGNDGRWRYRETQWSNGVLAWDNVAICVDSNEWGD